MTEKELKIVNGRIESLVNLFVQAKFENKNGICSTEQRKYCNLYHCDCDLCKKDFIAKYRNSVLAERTFKMENFNTEE